MLLFSVFRLTGTAVLLTSRPGYANTFEILHAMKIDNLPLIVIDKNNVAGRAARLFLVLLAGFFISCNLWAQGNKSDLFRFSVKKVRENIYVAYRPDPFRYFVEGNVTIIVNENDVVLVDGGGSPESAQNIIAEVKKLTKNPIRYVINTHDHVDHTFGNQEYVRAFPQCEIVAHPKSVTALLGSGSRYLKSTLNDLDSALKRGERLVASLKAENKEGNDAIIRYWDRYRTDDIFKRFEEYRKVTITPATMATEFMTIQRGNRTIEIRHIGWGDTPGDLIVYLPTEKVVCVGDMLTHPVPYGFTVNPFAWLNTLERLEILDFDILVPGHGDVQQGKKYLVDVMQMIKSVRRQVANGIQKGLDRDSVRAAIDVADFAHRYSNGDPVFHYRLKGWFTNPHAGVIYDSLKVLK
jgi:cyclase